MEPFNVGILGATGLVGQRLLQRLAGHPWFRVKALAASDRSAGCPYRETVAWRLSADPPEELRDLVVRSCDVEEMQDCDLVLSGLDSPIARGLEPLYAEAGFAVISNSSAFRQAPDVPLLIPEINPSQLALIARQRTTAGGFIVTNPNCAAIGLALALAPLDRAYGVRRVVVSTLQSLSGAGAAGPRAIDLQDNVVPFIRGEEEKLEIEMRKILGRVEAGELRESPVIVSAHCHRVPTREGHVESVSLELGEEVAPPDVARTLRAFRADPEVASLPSAPRRPVLVREEEDRPQPALDRDSDGGMALVVGRIRRCPVLGVKLVLLSHNTVRGAAGGTLLNAELLASRGLLPRRVLR